MKENNVNTGKKEIRFWRNPLTWRTTNTGMNENVISTYVQRNTSKDKVIADMRMNIAPYLDKRMYASSAEGKKKDYFVDVVNECMSKVWHKGTGHVFTDSQLREVMMILPSVSVRWSQKDECYYCCK